MNYEIKIPGISEPVTLGSVLTLDQALGLPNPYNQWVLVPPDVLIPTGTPVVRWYQHARGLGGLRVHVLDKPLWSAFSLQSFSTPEVLLVPKEYSHSLQEYPLPFPVPGKLVEVVLIDTSVGVLARGAQWHFTPSTTTEKYQEGTSYVCDDGMVFVNFLREEVVWWEDLRLGGGTHRNPMLKERIENDPQL